jgi:excinuclease ABC subunit C
MEHLQAKIKAAPHEPGVYVFRDAEGQPLYVGKAGDLRKRLLQHLRGESLGAWAERMRDRVADVEMIVTRTETEAFLLEANLIKQHKPPYNIRLTDDKSYPYLRLTDELFPRLVVLRDLPPGSQVRIPGRRGEGQRGFHEPGRKTVSGFKGGDIFGPYPTAGVMWQLKDLASRLFGLRQCRRQLTGEAQGRPCLNYHIKRCVGPCTGEVDPADYERLVNQVALLLEGRAGEVVADLQERMAAAAAALEFERAAMLRDRLKAVQAATEDQLITANQDRDHDALAAAAEDDVGVVELFPVRGGKLLQPLHFSFAHVRGRSLPEIIEACLTLHYSENMPPPRSLLLAEPLAEPAEWEVMLSGLRGSKVEVVVPQRGEKRRLVELAAKNARLALARVQGERARRQRDNQAALRDLAEALDLPCEPHRLECYDISNLQGTEAVGSMVVFTDGLADKKRYRRFRMRLQTGQQDDYAMLAEMIGRRLWRGQQGDEKFLPLPDLILVDGGKGQVSAALAVLEAAGADQIALAGLAKQREEVFVPGQGEPLDLEPHPRGWLLLQRLRDEAHRFAQSYHHVLRSRQVTRSEIEEVAGIGPVRRRALFRAFPSVQALREASEEELASVEGMTLPAAQKLKEFLLQPAEEVDEAPETDVTGC